MLSFSTFPSNQTEYLPVGKFLPPRTAVLRRAVSHGKVGVWLISTERDHPRLSEVTFPQLTTVHIFIGLGVIIALAAIGASILFYITK